MKLWFRKDRALYAKMKKLLKDLYEEFGWKTRVIAATLGLLGCFTIWMEKKRLSHGWTYEPPTFYEKNARALARDIVSGGKHQNTGWSEKISLPRAAMY